jgi:hypothetical protein
VLDPPRSAAAFFSLLVGLGCGNKTVAPVPAPGASPPLASPPAGELRKVSDFDVIADAGLRSAALFSEASRVLLHPRCTNCHPNGDVPLQGDGGFVHEPPVPRGPDDRGVVGMECSSCHQDANLELGRVPGAENWHLAARSMAWVGKTPRQVCEQLKDPARNGQKTLEAVAMHTEQDGLVAWAWIPGHNRTAPPGNQRAFGALMRAWVGNGAVCPEGGAPP